MKINLVFFLLQQIVCRYGTTLWVVPLGRSYWLHQSKHTILVVVAKLSIKLDTIAECQNVSGWPPYKMRSFPSRIGMLGTIGKVDQIVIGNPSNGPIQWIGVPIKRRWRNGSIGMHSVKGQEGMRNCMVDTTLLPNVGVFYRSAIPSLVL